MSQLVTAVTPYAGLPELLSSLAALVAASTPLVGLVLTRRKKAKKKARKQLRQQWTGSTPPTPAPPPPNETSAEARPDWYLRREPTLNTWTEPAPKKADQPGPTPGATPNRWWTQARAEGGAHV